MVRPTPALALSRSLVARRAAAGPAGAAAGAFRPTGRVLAVKPVFQPHAGRFTAESVSKWVPTLALWGAAGAGAVTLFFSGVPLFVHDVLSKVPVLSSYFEDKTPDSDKPF